MPLRRRLASWLREHRGALFALAVPCLVVAFRLREWWSPYTLPARGDATLNFQGSDLTPQWAPWVRFAVDSLWRHGALALWNPLSNGGTPQLAVPEAGVLSLPLLFGLLPGEAPIKGSMLAHVFLGMAAVFAIARQLRLSKAPAALGALAFGLNTYLLGHFRVGHLSHLYPMALMPWSWYLVLRALEAPRNFHRWALGAGAVVGLGVLEGGSSPVVYAPLALVLLAVGVPFEQDRLARLRRLVLTGLLVGIGAFAVSACQLLPMVDYLRGTGRNGLGFEHAGLELHEFHNAAPGIALLHTMALGWLFLMWRGPRAVAMWLGAVLLLSYGAAYDHRVYEFLWKHVPGFNLQRIAERALVLAGVAGPVLCAAALQAAFSVKRQGYLATMVAVAVVGGWLCRELWERAPEPARMLDVRQERSRNKAMQWLAANAKGARVHVWESENRHWGSDNVTQPFGLEVLASYTPSENRDYLPGDFDEKGHRTFLQATYSDPARLWGLMGVRYVTSTYPRRQEQGFRLATTVEKCPVEICQPARSSGPLVYENEKVLPRVFRAPGALALVGEPRKAFEASLDVLQKPEFDPAALALLQIPAGQPVPQQVEVISVGGAVAGAPQWGTPQADELLAKVLARSRREDPMGASALERHGPNRFTAKAPPGSGFVVISEKMALYPGWKVFVDGKEAQLLRADGVYAAVDAPPGSTIEARYRPPGFLSGLLVLAVALGGLFAYERFVVRRRAATAS